MTQVTRTKLENTIFSENEKKFQNVPCYLDSVSYIPVLPFGMFKKILRFFVDLIVYALTYSKNSYTPLIFPFEYANLFN